MFAHPTPVHHLRAKTRSLEVPGTCRDPLRRAPVSAVALDTEEERNINTSLLCSPPFVVCFFPLFLPRGSCPSAALVGNTCSGLLFALRDTRRPSLCLSGLIGRYVCCSDLLWGLPHSPRSSRRLNISSWKLPEVEYKLPEAPKKLATRVWLFVHLLLDQLRPLKPLISLQLYARSRLWSLLGTSGSSLSTSPSL